MYTTTITKHNQIQTQTHHPQSCQAICHTTKFWRRAEKRNSDIRSDRAKKKPPHHQKRTHQASHCLALNKTIKPLPFRTERRQLCKFAYQRCLELIIDLDAFNKLPELNESERKSKRARVNKDGLPNLSKHNALIRISNEMILIKSMNDSLKKLIENR